MSISQEQVAKIATLARLSFTQDELTELTSEFQTILDLFNHLESTNETDNIEPLAHPLESKQLLRQDESQDVGEQETLQNLASQTENNLYLVPQVIEDAS